MELTYLVESAEAPVLLVEVDADALHAGRTLVAVVGARVRTVRVGNHEVVEVDAVGVGGVLDAGIIKLHINIKNINSKN